MSLEATTNAIEDHLIDAISFKLAPGASYVTDRRSVSFFPQGSNIYKPQTGTKVIKIALTGTGEWLDPSTLQLQFKLENGEQINKALFVVGQPHSFFRRARLMCGGTVVEDIDQYNRVHEMLSVLSGKFNRDMDDVSSVSKRWDSDEVYDIISQNLLDGTFNDEEPRFNVTGDMGLDITDPVDAAKANGIYTKVNGKIDALTAQDKDNLRRKALIWYLQAGRSKVVSTKLAFGLLHQPKWIPLRYAPLTLELELVNDFTDVCVIPTNNGGVNERFPTTHTSTTWQISQVEVKCDLCTLDNALENSYEAHLLDKGTLPINYNTYINQTQNITGQVDIAINVSRAISRLKSVFINFSKKTSQDRISPNRGEAITNATAAGSTWDNGILASFGDINKPWNGFYHPMGGQFPNQQIYNPDLELEYQVQIGSKQFPEYPIRSLAETFCQLRKTMGILGSNVGIIDIMGQQYNKLHHIIALDTEKTLQAGYTGLDMKRGQLMTIKVKATNPTALDAARMPDNIHIVLHSDQILDIGFTGTQVQD